MPVFDATQNQVLFSPVSNYYKGKDIRAELKAAEQESELRQMEIDNAPAAIAAANEKAALDRQQAILDVQKGIEDLGYTRMKRRSDALAPVVQEAEKMFKAGDVEGASNYIAQGVPAALQDVDPQAAEELMAMAGPDKVWQPEEMMRLKHRVEAFGVLEDEGDGSLEAVNFGTADGEILETHQKGSPGWKDAMERGLHIIGPAAQTQRTRDLTAEGAAAEVVEKNKVAQELRSGLRAYTKTPGAGGMGGFITDKIGGLAGSLPMGVGVGLEEFISNTFSGASSDDVQAARSQAQTLLPPFLRMITGDTSRYSDKDVELAKEAEKAQHPTASQTQIIGALSNMARVAYRDAFRSMKLAKQDLPFTFDKSPEDQEAMNNFVQGLRDDGMSDAAIEGLLLDLESLTKDDWSRVGLPRDLTK